MFTSILKGESQPLHSRAMSNRFVWTEFPVTRASKPFAGVLKGDPGHKGRPGYVGGSVPNTAGQVRVGITSAGTQVGAEAHTKDVEQSMHGFARQLKSLPGVSQISVVKGRGIFFGVGEPTWVVSYTGNGNAYKLLAETGKKFNQDAVLIMREGTTDALVQLTFDRRVSHSRRDHIQAVLTKQGIDGGTWFGNEAHQAVLQMASVQAWKGNKAQHIARVTTLQKRLAGMGFKSTMQVHDISTEVLGRDQYDAVLKK